MLKGKTVVLGVTGSIAAYKMANVASMLVKMHCDVHVIMTRNATNFINPITFETLTNHKCLVDTFDRNFQFHVAHVSLAQQADVMLIAPASANIIAKMTYGLADDMLSTTILAASCPKLVAPAMNTHMYDNPVTQENLERLRQRGIRVIEPASGFLACRAVGRGKLPEERVLVDHILQEIAREKDLAGVRLLVTAGPTREALDPVRYLTNHSSGKMGYAIARVAAWRGAKVTLVSGPVSGELRPPLGVELVPVVTAGEMFEAVVSRMESQAMVIKAAAVADYRPVSVSEDKIKKSGDDAGDVASIPVERTRDILAYLGEHKRPDQAICGFSMETRDILENSRAKLRRKKVDMIAANSLKEAGAGFQTDTNHLVLITGDGEMDLGMRTKEEAADLLLTKLYGILQESRGAGE